VQQGKCEEVIIKARLSEKEKKGKWYIRNATTFKVKSFRKILLFFKFCSKIFNKIADLISSKKLLLYKYSSLDSVAINLHVTFRNMSQLEILYFSSDEG